MTILTCPPQEEAVAMAKGAHNPSDDFLRSIDGAFELTHELLREQPVTNEESLLRLAYVGFPAPPQLVPETEIKPMKLREGKQSCKGRAEAACKIVGRNLSEARRRARLKQMEAAEATGIGERTLRRIEGGEREPSARELVALSALYGISVGRLLGLISDEEERLLDLYEYGTQKNREYIVKWAAEAHENEAVASENAHQIKASLQKRLENGSDQSAL